MRYAQGQKKGIEQGSRGAETSPSSVEGREKQHERTRALRATPGARRNPRPSLQLQPSPPA